MTIVVDASACVAALTDDGPTARQPDSPTDRWAEGLLLQTPIVAPQLILVEATDVLRRLAASGTFDDVDASAAHRDLMTLPIDLYPFAPLADRIWALRHDVSSHDAWYVALAERLDAPLATLDQRLVNAPGARCRSVSADGLLQRELANGSSSIPALSVPLKPIEAIRTDFLQTGERALPAARDAR